jgi:hypothetical protein
VSRVTPPQSEAPWGCAGQRHTSGSPSRLPLPARPLRWKETAGGSWFPGCGCLLISRGQAARLGLRASFRTRRPPAADRRGLRKHAALPASRAAEASFLLPPLQQPINIPWARWERKPALQCAFCPWSTKRKKPGLQVETQRPASQDSESAAQALGVWREA